MTKKEFQISLALGTLPSVYYLVDGSVVIPPWRYYWPSNVKSIPLHEILSNHRFSASEQKLKQHIADNFDQIVVEWYGPVDVI